MTVTIAEVLSETGFVSILYPTVRGERKNPDVVPGALTAGLLEVTVAVMPLLVGASSKALTSAFWPDTIESTSTMDTILGASNVPVRVVVTPFKVAVIVKTLSLVVRGSVKECDSDVAPAAIVSTRVDRFCPKKLLGPVALNCTIRPPAGAALLA